MRSFILKFSIAILIMVVTLELLLRIFIPAPIYRRVRRMAPDFYRPAPWLMQPVANYDVEEFGDGDIPYPYRVRTNADGMRSADVTREKAPQTYRLLALGDSFTFGMPVENDETFAALIPHCLESTASYPNFDSVNAGFNGYSHDSFYVFYHQLGQLYNPDWVTVGIYVGNDLQDLMEMEWKSDERGLPVEVRSTIRHVDTRLGQMVWKETPINYRYPIIRDFNIFQYAYLLFHKPDGNYIALDSERVISSPYLPTEDWNAAANLAFEKSLFVLKALYEDVRANGQQFLAILIPETVQLENPTPQQNPQARYREAFEAAGIPYIDLLFEFEGYEVYDLYTSPRRHWHPLGHQVTAQAVCDYVNQAAWIP